MARGPLRKEWGKQKGLQCPGHRARPRSRTLTRQDRTSVGTAPLSPQGSSPPLLPGQCGSLTAMWTSTAWHPAPASLPPRPPGHPGLYLSPGSLVLGTGSLAGIPDAFPLGKRTTGVLDLPANLVGKRGFLEAGESKSRLTGFPGGAPLCEAPPHSFSELQHHSTPGGSKEQGLGMSVE